MGGEERHLGVLSGGPYSGLGNGAGNDPPHFLLAPWLWKWKYPQCETTEGGPHGLGQTLWDWQEQETSGSPSRRPGTSTYLAARESAPSLPLPLVISGMDPLGAFSEPVRSWIEPD